MDDGRWGGMSGSKKRHVGRYVVLGFIIVLIIAGFFTYRALHKTSAGAITYTTQAVQQLTITSSVSGTGNISLSSSASVNPIHHWYGQQPPGSCRRRGDEG